MCKEKFRTIIQGGKIYWSCQVKKNRIKKATQEVKIKQQRKGE